MTLGVHFALTDDQLAKLLSLKSTDARIEYIQEDIEEDWDEENLQETDKAWDAIHRCLTDHPPDTPELESDRGEYPLKLCVLGGEAVVEDSDGYTVRLVKADQVPDLVAALDPIDEKWLAGKYHACCKGAWPEYGEEDLEYTWENFIELREFFRRAAKKGRGVIFTVSG